MALSWESHSLEIRSKNKPVYENTVRGMWGSCIFQVMGSWWNLRDLGTEAQSLTWSSQLWALFKWERSEDLNGIWTLTSAIPMRYSSGWAIRPTRSRSSCKFMITPRGCMDISVESMKIMFERWSEVQLVKHYIVVVRVAFVAEFFRPSFGCCLRRAHNCDDHVKVCLLDFF